MVILRQELYAIRLLSLSYVIDSLLSADLPSVHLLVFVCVVQHAHEKFLRN